MQKENVKALSDFQLYALIQSKYAPHLFIQDFKNELSSRSIPNDQMEQMQLKLEQKSLNSSSEGLSFDAKFILILIPLITIFHVLYANNQLKQGSQKRWKQCWQYIFIGHCVWFILFLLIIGFI